MKKMLTLLLTVALLSCQKDRVSPVAEIAGKWEIRKEEGSIRGTVTYAPGNGDIMEFKKNGTYNRILNGVVEETGTFTLQTSATSGLLSLVMNSPSGTDTISVNLNVPELVFLRPVDCCDYPNTTYVMIQKY